MPPVISFNHANLYLNTGLVPASGFRVNHATSITISLGNTGSETGNVNIHLWWVGPCVSPPAGPMIDLVSTSKLAPPYCGVAIKFSVVMTTGGSVTVSWTPSAADFPRSLGTSVPGCLFAQAEVLPSPPTYPGDTTALNNWNPAYTLCAQHNIQIAT